MDTRGGYRFSSLVKQNKKAKICFAIHMAREKKLLFYIYFVIVKQKFINGLLITTLSLSLSHTHTQQEARSDPVNARARGGNSKRRLVINVLSLLHWDLYVGVILIVIIIIVNLIVEYSRSVTWYPALNCKRNC